MACAAMLTGLLYDDILPFFSKCDHRGGLFPDDVIDVIESLGITCHKIQKLPKRQPALVAIEWSEKVFGGHFIVWDPKRKQFIDPTHGLVGCRKMLRTCRIEHIWSIGKKGMKELIKARMAKVVAEKYFQSFNPEAINLGRTTDGRFVINVRFVYEPPIEAQQILNVEGFATRLFVKGELK